MKTAQYPKMIFFKLAVRPQNKPHLIDPFIHEIFYSYDNTMCDMGEQDHSIKGERHAELVEGSNVHYLSV